MKIKKILVTQQQPETEKSPYQELAEKNKLQIDFRPFICIEGVSSKEFRQSKVDILEHSAVIFCSRTAIDHFFRICEELRVVVPETMKYFCMSESIAYYLQKYIVYRKRKIFFGKTCINDLHEAFMKNKEEKYLLPLSDTHKDDIPNALKALGLKYNKAVLYKTVSSNLTDIPDLLNYDVVVFYSPSGVKSLIDNFPKFKQNQIMIASFGQATAKAVQDAGLRLDIKAPAPETPSMTMALERFIKDFNKSNGKK